MRADKPTSAHTRFRMHIPLAHATTCTQTIPHKSNHAHMHTRKQSIVPLQVLSAQANARVCRRMRASASGWSHMAGKRMRTLSYPCTSSCAEVFEQHISQGMSVRPKPPMRCLCAHLRTSIQHTHIRTCTHAHPRTRTHTHTHSRTRAFIHTRTHTHTHTPATPRACKCPWPGCGASA